MNIFLNSLQGKKLRPVIFILVVAVLAKAQHMKNMFKGIEIFDYEVANKDIRCNIYKMTLSQNPPGILQPKIDAVQQTITMEVNPNLYNFELIDKNGQYYSYESTKIQVKYPSRFSNALKQQTNNFQLMDIDLWGKIKTKDQWEKQHCLFAFSFPVVRSDEFNNFSMGTGYEALFEGIASFQEKFNITNQALIGGLPDNFVHFQFSSKEYYYQNIVNRYISVQSLPIGSQIFDMVKMRISDNLMTGSDIIRANGKTKIMEKAQLISSKCNQNIDFSVLIRSGEAKMAGYSIYYTGLILIASILMLLL